MTTPIETLSEHGCHGGRVGYYRHASAATGTDMRFAVFVPPGAGSSPRPTLVYLAGLTCTEETFMIKAGAQRLAAELGLVLVAPDTSPRGCALPGEDEDWDFGSGAGFYLDATQEPWAPHYRMETYVTEELRQLVEAHFPVRSDAVGIFGHSMGGHGALTLALRHPELYRSVSAFAPIAAPIHCPWGQKAFGGYLGDDPASWRGHDACELLLAAEDASRVPPILVDQGLADGFLEEQLHPHRLEEAAAKAGARLELRRHEGYDHGYFFIASFVDDHLRHHARQLAD